MLRYILPVIPFMTLFAAVGGGLELAIAAAAMGVRPESACPRSPPGSLLLLAGLVGDFVALARALASDRDTRDRRRLAQAARAAGFPCRDRGGASVVHPRPGAAAVHGALCAPERGLAWYRAHGVDFAVVDAQSPLRTTDAVFRVPSPSCMLAYADVVTRLQDTLPLIDPSVLIVPKR